MRNSVPERERCAQECGRRHAPNDVLCSVCRKRKERSFGAPGRAVAIPALQREREPYPEHEQERDLKELSRCSECGAPYGGHNLSCSYFQFIDATSEYREAADAAEMDA